MTDVSLPAEIVSPIVTLCIAWHSLLNWLGSGTSARTVKYSFHYITSIFFILINQNGEVKSCQEKRFVRLFHTPWWLIRMVSVLPIFSHAISYVCKWFTLQNGLMKLAPGRLIFVCPDSEFQPKVPSAYYILPHRDTPISVWFSREVHHQMGMIKAMVATLRTEITVW